MLRYYIVRCDLEELIRLLLEHFKKNNKNSFYRPYFNNVMRYFIVEQIADIEVDYILEEMIGRGVIRNDIIGSQNGRYEIINPPEIPLVL